MQRNRRKFLSDMLERAERARRIAAGRELADIIADEVLCSAIERELSVIGEALMQLHRIEPETAERVERWRDIIGFRHVLVHGYHDLDMAILWATVRDDLPKLIPQLQAMLAEDP